MRFALSIATVLVLASTMAHAGDNSCTGTVIVEGPTGKIVTEEIRDKAYVLNGVVIPEYVQPSVTCGKFTVNSPVGRRILKICPNGSNCNVEQPLEWKSLALKPTHIERW